MLIIATLTSATLLVTLFLGVYSVFAGKKAIRQGVEWAYVIEEDLDWEED